MGGDEVGERGIRARELRQVEALLHAGDEMGLDDHEDLALVRQDLVLPLAVHADRELTELLVRCDPRSGKEAGANPTAPRS